MLSLIIENKIELIENEIEFAFIESMYLNI